MVCCTKWRYSTTFFKLEPIPLYLPQSNLVCYVRWDYGILHRYTHITHHTHHTSHTTHITHITHHTHHTHHISHITHISHTSHTTYKEMLITCSTFLYIQTYHTSHHTPHTSHTTYNEMLITCSTFHYIQTYHTTHHTIHTSHHTHITYNAMLITCSKFHCNDNYHAHNTLPVIRISFAYIRIIISKNIIHPSLSSQYNLPVIIIISPPLQLFMTQLTR